MMSTAKQLLERLAPLHAKLDELKKVSDDTWYQGGMTWNAELLHRGASAAKINDSHVSKFVDAFSDNQFAQNLRCWAEFVWSARGQRGNFENIIDEATWEIEKARCVNLCMQEAQDLFEQLRPSGKHERCVMVAEIDNISINLEAILTSGKHAIRHTAFWSVD